MASGIVEKVLLYGPNINGYWKKITSSIFILFFTFVGSYHEQVPDKKWYSGLFIKHFL